MKRVLMVIATSLPVLGGTQRQCWLLARELHRRGHEVALLTRGGRGTSSHELVDGVAVSRTPTIGAGHWESLVWTLTATAWLRRHGRCFDILQCYQMLSPAHVGILGRSGRQAIVVRPACSGPYGDVAEAERLPFTGLRKRLLRRVNAFVTLSGEIEDELAGFGLGAIPCHRIGNGVDLATFFPASGEERRALRGRLELPEDRVLCVFVGRLTPQKDPDLLLEAWAMGRWPDTHLILVGDGPLRNRLEARAASGSLAGHITFVGARTDVAEYLRAADLLVLPSRAEGMSNALLEAMACGIPVVASDLPANREVVGRDGRTGSLVAPGDAAALAEAIRKLVKNPSLRHEIGSAARLLVQSHFDIERVADRYLSLYAGLSLSASEGFHS